MFDEMNDLFQRATSGSSAEYETLPPGLDASALEAIVAWLADAGLSPAPAAGAT